MNRVPDLVKLFIDLLISIRVGRGVWRRFGSEMLQRFIKNNPNNIWDSDIVDLTVIMNSFRDNSRDDETDRAIGKGITIAKNIIIKQFKTLAIDWELTIAYKFKPGSREYIEFYPHGLTGIHEANLTNMGLVMSTIITAADKYEAILGQGFSDPMKTIYTNFINISKEHVEQKSIIDEDKNVLDQDVSNLRKITTKLLCGVAYRFHGAPNKLNTYFDLSILKMYGEHDRKISHIFEGVIAADTSKILSNKITEKDILTIKTTGTVPLTYSLSNTEDAATGISYIVNPGDELTVDLSEQANPKIPFLICTNKDTSTEGKYYIEIR